MGGRGSGRSPGYGFDVDLCEHHKDIDIAWLRKQNALETGYIGCIHWSHRGKRYATINYRIQPSGLRLIYRTRPLGGTWHNVDELIPFVETQTRFGGRRKWFSCPSCHRRCRVIYGGAHFRCRTCHGLKYESQYESPICRISSKRHKLRDRLGQSGSLSDLLANKPKGMHWRTYLRIMERDDELAATWCARASDWLKRTEPRQR